MLTVKYKERYIHKGYKESLDHIMPVFGGVILFLYGLFGSLELLYRSILIIVGILLIVVPVIVSVQSDKLYITVNSKVIHGKLKYFRYFEFPWSDIHHIEIIKLLLMRYGYKGVTCSSLVWRLIMSDYEKLVDTIKKYAEQNNIPCEVKQSYL
jgi:hypothetical protein